MDLTKHPPIFGQALLRTFVLASFGKIPNDPFPSSELPLLFLSRGTITRGDLPS